MSKVSHERIIGIDVSRIMYQAVSLPAGGSANRGNLGVPFVVERHPFGSAGSRTSARARPTMSTLPREQVVEKQGLGSYFLHRCNDRTADTSGRVRFWSGKLPAPHKLFLYNINFRLVW